MLENKKVIGICGTPSNHCCKIYELMAEIAPGKFQLLSPFSENKCLVYRAEELEDLGVTIFLSPIVVSDGTIGFCIGKKIHSEMLILGDINDELKDFCRLKGLEYDLYMIPSPEISYIRKKIAKKYLNRLDHIASLYESKEELLCAANGIHNLASLKNEELFAEAGLRICALYRLTNKGPMVDYFWDLYLKKVYPNREFFHILVDVFEIKYSNK